MLKLLVCPNLISLLIALKERALRAKVSERQKSECGTCHQSGFPAQIVLVNGSTKKFWPQPFNLVIRNYPSQTSTHSQLKRSGNSFQKLHGYHLLGVKQLTGFSRPSKMLVSAIWNLVNRHPPSPAVRRNVSS